MIIDNKGRIFGVINIIDFLVLFFLLCLIPMVWFNWRVKLIEPVKTCEDCNVYKDKIENFLKEHKRAKKYFN